MRHIVGFTFMVLSACIVGAIAQAFELHAFLSLALTALTAATPAWIGWHRARNALHTQTQRAREFTQRLIDVIPQPVFVKDAQRNYIMVNQAFAEDRNMTVAQMTGMPSSALASSEFMAIEVEKEDLAALRGEKIQNEIHEQHNGEDRYRQVMKGVCQDINGEPVILGINFNITPWRSAEIRLEHAIHQLKEQHQRTLEYIQRILDVLPYPVYVKDHQGRYLLANQAMATHKGLSVEALLGQNNQSLGTSLEKQTQIQAEDAAVLAGASVSKEEYLVRDNGKEVYQRITKKRCLDSMGIPVVVGVNVDLSDLRLAEKNLHDTLEREINLRKRAQSFTQQLLDLIPNPAYIKDKDSRFIMVNKAFCEEKHQSADALIGKPSTELARDQDDAVITKQEDERVIQGENITKEQRTTNEEYRVVYKRNGIDVDGQPIIFGLYHYFTHWKKAEIELQHQAFEDSLTGIANRRHFSAEAVNALAYAARNQSPISLALFDMDHFKQINDAHGHPVGDEVLIEAVKRFQQGLRRSDLIGRWGGEEFIVLLPFTPRDEAFLVAERLRAATENQLFHTAAGELSITVSGGLVEYVQGETLEHLIKRADSALYRAKQAGRNRVCQ